MSWKQISKKLPAMLRDPLWQSLGVIVAIVGVAVAILAWRRPEIPRLESSKLLIYPDTTANLTDFPDAVASRTRILIDGKDERDVKYFVYVIDYRGSRPIVKTDFEGAIRAIVPENRKVLAVQPSKDTLDLYAIRNGRFEWRTSKAPCEVQKVDDRIFEIKPTLINPDEWCKFEIYTAAKVSEGKPNDADTIVRSDEKPLQEGEFTWTCRIAGISCEPKKSRFDASDDVYKAPPWYLSLHISHEGWSIYFIVGFTNLNLIGLIFVARYSRVALVGPIAKLLLFVLAISLSMAVAETLADRLFNETQLWFFGETDPMIQQPAIATIYLLIDAATFAMLTLDVISRKRKKSKAQSR